MLIQFHSASEICESEVKWSMSGICSMTRLKFDMPHSIKVYQPFILQPESEVSTTAEDYSSEVR